MKSLARHDTLIAIIGTAILTAGYYWGVVQPGRIASANVEQEIVQAHAKMNEVPLLLAEQTHQQSQLERQQQRIEQMESALPGDSHASEVLHEVASLASHSGLTITRLEPLQTIEFASYASHPFHLGCRGAFDDVAKFLKGLETESRLVSFSKIDLTRSQDGVDGTGRTIQVNIDFSVFSRHAKF